MIKSATKQSIFLCAAGWIASRSLSSDAHSRDPLARNDGELSGFCKLADLFDDRFLDVAKLILAEKHFLPDKEGRRTECAAVDRVGGQVDQPLLDVILLRPRHQPFDIDA